MEVANARDPHPTISPDGKWIGYRYVEGPLAMEKMAEFLQKEVPRLTFCPCRPVQTACAGRRIRRVCSSC